MKIWGGPCSRKSHAHALEADLAGHDGSCLVRWSESCLIAGAGNTPLHRVGGSLAGRCPMIHHGSQLLDVFAEVD